MRPTPYVASLRVYEPLESFPKRDQLQWLSISAQSDSLASEQTQALARTITSSSPFQLADGAHLIEIESRKFAAPWSTAMRSWAALNNFKQTLPPNVSKLFIPYDLEESLHLQSVELEAKIPHILSETWVIPPRWFALFEPSERMRGRISEVPFTLVRTKMEKAKQRCIKTHSAVRNAFGPGPVEEELVHLLNWLNVFNSESIVELDYGGLAQYLDQALRQSGEEGIECDTSIEDVQNSVAGLGAGDGVQAGQGYERLVSRWRKVAAYEQAM